MVEEAVSAALLAGFQRHFRLAEERHHVVGAAGLDQADADREADFAPPAVSRTWLAASRIRSATRMASKSSALGKRKARQPVL